MTKVATTEVHREGERGLSVVSARQTKSDGPGRGGHKRSKQDKGRRRKKFCEGRGKNCVKFGEMKKSRFYPVQFLHETQKSPKTFWLNPVPDNSTTSSG